MFPISPSGSFFNACSELRLRSTKVITLVIQAVSAGIVFPVLLMNEFLRASLLIDFTFNAVAKFFVQVHFRAYPTEVLTLCEVEAVKWNFVNTLKEVQVNSAFDVLIQF